MRPHNHGQRLQIEQGEKIDRAKLTIDRRRSADLGPDREIGAEQARCSRDR